MQNQERDWIVYLDDTLRSLDKVSSASSIDVGVTGTLPRVDVGFNSEFTIKNESPDVVYFVRGCDARITPIPVAKTPIYDLDTLATPSISIYIRTNHVNHDNPKKNKNDAVRYALDYNSLIAQSIYIPEVGGFLCSLSQLNRVTKICKTRYQPVAPDSAMPVWIYAHATNSRLTHLYATVNNRIVRIPVQRGSTDHAVDRVIYYQWSYTPERQNTDVLDTIPTDHFLKSSLWETKHGEYISTSYDELKHLLIKRGIDMDYIDVLKEQLRESQKNELAYKSVITKLMNPEIQQDLLSEKYRERGIKRMHDAFDLIDRVASVAKSGQDIHDKYKAQKRKSIEDKFIWVKQAADAASGVMRVLTPFVAMVGSILKLLK